MAALADPEPAAARRKVRDSLARSMAALRQGIPARRPRFHPLLRGARPHWHGCLADLDALWHERTRRHPGRGGGKEVSGELAVSGSDTPSTMRKKKFSILCRRR